jgi:hypothetical protein
MIFRQGKAAISVRPWDRDRISEVQDELKRSVQTVDGGALWAG